MSSTMLHHTSATTEELQAKIEEYDQSAGEENNEVEDEGDQEDDLDGQQSDEQEESSSGEDSDDDKKTIVKFEDDLKPQVTAKEEQLMYTLFGNKEKLLQNLENVAKEDGKITAAPTKSRKSVWQDLDDSEEEVEGKKRRVHTENAFHKNLGVPAWADLDAKEDVDSDEEILQSVGKISTVSSTQLPTNVLQFKRLKDLNRATYLEGPVITAVQFHPQSSVAIVTGLSGIATIYSIDGQKNDKLHSIQFKNYPIKSCRMDIDGVEAIIGGSKKYCYTYDLMTGSTQRVFLPKGLTKMNIFEISPCGKFLAIIARFGEIVILSTKTKEFICSLKQENQSVAIAFSTDSKRLYSHSCDAEIFVFDLTSQRLMHRFYDEGCVNGSALALSPNGNYLAAGSAQGVVNIYSTAQTLTSKSPKPLKTILNLTTEITTCLFNSTSELLAISSRHVADAVKMVNVSSGTVYSNFPGIQGKLGKPNVLSFSPQSGYLAIGNVAKEVPLYRLKHFNNY